MEKLSGKRGRFETRGGGHFGNIVREERKVGDQGALWECCQGREEAWRPKNTLLELSAKEGDWRSRGTSRELSGASAFHIPMLRSNFSSR